jgi:NAD(P)-dependent dehydrogenase (short-subunit alcohol dehydrogenase family)
MDFTGEIAVVTGAASGIGRAIAIALAGNGAVVVAVLTGTARDEGEVVRPAASTSPADRLQFWSRHCPPSQARSVRRRPRGYPEGLE